MLETNILKALIRNNVKFNTYWQVYNLFEELKYDS